MAIRILELRSVRGTGGGPEKTILLGAARSDPDRFAVTVCYLRDARDDQFSIDARAARMGLDYVEIRERHSFDPSIWPALRRLIRERNIDIVHAHEHKTDLLCLLLARAEAVIPLATAHGWSGLSLKERGYYFFDRRLLARYPIVIAVSEQIRRTIIAHGGDARRVRRISNGIDHLEFQSDLATRERLRATLGIAPGTLVVGAVGRLEAVKRFDVLLEAVAHLNRRERPIVMLVGEGPCRTALTTQAASLGLSDCLLLVGQRDDARELHQVLDVYVQTSDSEGVPNALLEAMALRTPVVATDVGGTSDLITHEVHGLLVPRRTPAATAHAIERTLHDREATSRRVDAARARIERELSFDARMQAVEGIYEELMTDYRPVKSRRAVRWA